MNAEFPKISIKAARVNAKYSQKEAAKHLHVNVRTLQKYENGEVMPQWDKVKAMEKLYMMSADYFFFGSNIADSDENKESA